jgi:hypothetical protein
MWVDVGRRDVHLADGWDTLGPRRIEPAPAGPCSMPGCQRPGEHEGLCGRHFWQATSRQQVRPPKAAGEIQTPWMRHTTGRLADAYLAAVELVQTAPLNRWVLLSRMLDQPAPLRRRVRAILSLAAGKHGLQVETGHRWRLRVTDRQAAVDSLEEAARATQFWRQAVAELAARRVGRC